MFTMTLNEEFVKALKIMRKSGYDLHLEFLISSHLMFHVPQEVGVELKVLSLH